MPRCLPRRLTRHQPPLMGCPCPAPRCPKQKLLTNFLARHRVMRSQRMRLYVMCWRRLPAIGFMPSRRRSRCPKPPTCVYMPLLLDAAGLLHGRARVAWRAHPSFAPWWHGAGKKRLLQRAREIISLMRIPCFTEEGSKRGDLRGTQGAPRQKEVQAFAGVVRLAEQTVLDCTSRTDKNGRARRAVTSCWVRLERLLWHGYSMT